MSKCDRDGCGDVLDETGFCVRCHRRPQATSAKTPEVAGSENGPIDRVPEDKRCCARCMAKVGRGHDGRPGRDHGFCPQCAEAFDFLPPLQAGKMVAQRYRVVKALAPGGFGWAYLAHDENLDRPVVLKTLIHDQVAETVERERTVLTNLEHPNVVRIFDFVADAPRCLVLGYVEGLPAVPVPAGEPLDDVLDYGLQTLEALRYLHGKGLLHCDVKPENALRADGTVRLIDFGAIREIGSTKPLGPHSPDYAPPPGDPERRRPTPGFDLYCVGRTLRKLSYHHLKERRGEPGVKSLSKLLARATDTRVPGRRFSTARQFADQLRGVRRVFDEARDEGRLSASTVFAAMTDPLYGGLGMIPPLEHWLGNDLASWPRAGVPVTRPPLPSPFTAPTPSEVVAALPTVLADFDDGTDARVQQLLGSCHGALLLGGADEAAEALANTSLPTYDWRHSWYSALIALIRNDVTTAAVHFELTWEALPGEVVPTLARGLCAELRRDRQTATRLYEDVVRVDGSLAAAEFGLARCHLADGHRDRATEAVDRVARRFGFDRAARIAMVRVPAAVLPDEGWIPRLADLDMARRRLGDLDLEPQERARLEAEIAYAELGCVGWSAPARKERLRLWAALRALVAQTRTQADHTAMADRANAIRPIIRLSW